MAVLSPLSLPLSLSLSISLSLSLCPSPPLSLPPSLSLFLFLSLPPSLPPSLSLSLPLCICQQCLQQTRSVCGRSSLLKQFLHMRCVLADIACALSHRTAKRGIAGEGSAASSASGKSPAAAAFHGTKGERGGPARSGAVPEAPRGRDSVFLQKGAVALAKQPYRHITVLVLH